MNSSLNSTCLLNTNPHVIGSQLLEDLDDRLVTLEDKMVLSNAVLRDLMELQSVLTVGPSLSPLNQVCGKRQNQCNFSHPFQAKNLSDGPFPAQK